MDEVVSTILGYVDDAVAAAGKSMFAQTLSGVATIAQVLMGILVVVVGLMTAIGAYRVTAADLIQILIRIGLIFMFAFTWTNFEAFYQALTETTGAWAIGFFKAAGSVDNLGASGAMDKFGTQMGSVVDSVAKAQSSITRGLVAGILYIILSLMLAAYILIVAFSKIMLAILIGIAPVAIVMTLFKKTQSFFESWLSSFISYSMFPVAAAGVAGTMVTVAKEVFTSGKDVSNLGQIVAFLVVVFVAKAVLISIPIVAKNITGHINLAEITPKAMHSVGQASGLNKAGEMINMRIKSHLARGSEFLSGARTGMSTGANAAQQAEKAAQAGRSAAELGAAFRQRILPFTGGDKK